MGPLEQLQQQAAPAQGNQGLNMLQELVKNNYETSQAQLQQRRSAEELAYGNYVAQSRVQPTQQQLDAEAYGAWGSTPAPSNMLGLDYMGQAFNRFNKVRGEQAREQLGGEMNAAKLMASEAEKQRMSAQTEHLKNIEALKGSIGRAGGVGKNGAMFTLPDGTPVYKTGTELFTVGPEGERNVWRPTDKVMLGADVKAKLVEDELKAWIDSRQWPATMSSEDEERIISTQRAKISSRYGNPQPSVAPTTPSTATSAPAAPTASVAAPIESPEATMELTHGTDKTALLQQLEASEKEAVALGDMARARDIQQAKTLLRGQMGTAAAMPARKDVPKQEMEKSTAEETGKSLGKQFEALQSASAASSDLKVQLNTLKGLFANPNLPEGELAQGIQSVRSGLTSLGMLTPEEAKTVGQGDIINAISGKLALLTRTADGNNLMPGAMSDFEQKILRGLAPNLNQTKEGRLQLIELLSNMADVRIRMAQEADKLAQDNRGILPSSWYARRDRVMKEEMARMMHLSRQMNPKESK